MWTEAVGDGSESQGGEQKELCRSRLAGIGVLSHCLFCLAVSLR